MTKERFTEILLAEKYTPEQIEMLWNEKPVDFTTIPEQAVREVSREMYDIIQTMDALRKKHAADKLNLN